jgi:hypothetical protein
MSKKKSRRSSRTRKQDSSSLLIPIIVVLVLVVIAGGALIIAELGNRSPGGSSALENTAEPLSTNSIPFPDVPRISVQETQDLMAKGQAVLVDVRSSESYAKSRAAGAISIPEDQMEARMQQLPRDKMIVLYCT